MDLGCLGFHGRRAPESLFLMEVLWLEFGEG